MHGQNQQRLNLWCPIIINERLDIKTAHTQSHTQTKTSNTSTNTSIWMEWAIDGLSIGVTERRIDQPHLCMNTRKHERMGCILWHILHMWSIVKYHRFIQIHIASVVQLVDESNAHVQWVNDTAAVFVHARFDTLLVSFPSEHQLFIKWTVDYKSTFKISNRFKNEFNHLSWCFVGILHHWPPHIFPRCVAKQLAANLPGRCMNVDAKNRLRSFARAQPPPRKCVGTSEWSPRRSPNFCRTGRLMKGSCKCYICTILGYTNSE